MKVEAAGGRDRELRSLRCFEQNKSRRFAPDAPGERVCSSATPAFW
jgi:hypothetical protein